MSEPTDTPDTTSTTDEQAIEPRPTKKGRTRHPALAGMRTGRPAEATPEEAQASGPEWTYKLAEDEPSLAGRSGEAADDDDDEAAFEKQLDDLLDQQEADAAARFAPPPAPATEWHGYDPSGLAQPLRVKYSGGALVITLSLRKTGATLATLDNGHQQVKSQATEGARRLREVIAWKAAVKDQVAHQRAARASRAKAVELAARREVALCTDTAPGLAERLLALDTAAKAATAEAVKAEELAALAGQAVVARRREAERAVDAHAACSATGTSAQATRDVEQALDDLLAQVGEQLDKLAALKLSRDSIGGVVALDKTALTRSLLATLEAEATLEASRPPSPEPPA